jgi:hypothetical protein
VTLCPLSCLLMLQIWSPTFSSTSPCALGACSTEIKNKFHTDKSIIWSSSQSCETAHLLLHNQSQTKLNPPGSPIPSSAW